MPGVIGETLILQWDYPYYVAVDNIQVAAVPEPGTIVLLATIGAGAVAFKRKRRMREAIEG